MDIMEMLLESVAWIAVGFVPTLLCLEMSWSMGKITGKRRLTRGILQQTTIRGIK
jgi:hypothetical protein